MGLTSALQARRGPEELVLVRHGESAGNIADTEARDADAERLELSARDADVELSANGEEQARTLGRWAAGLAEGERPDLVVCSPYRRAADTARAALADLDVELLMDERLRERDLGLLRRPDRQGHPGAGIPRRPSAAHTSASSTTSRPPGRAGPTWCCERAACWPTCARGTTASGCGCSRTRR